MMKVTMFDTKKLKGLKPKEKKIPVITDQAEKKNALEELIKANPHMMDAWNGVEKYRKEHNGELPPVTPPQEAEEWEKAFDEQFTMIDKKGREVWTNRNFCDPRGIKEFIVNERQKILFKVKDLEGEMVNGVGWNRMHELVLNIIKYLKESI